MHVTARILLLRYVHFGGSVEVSGAYNNAMSRSSMFKGFLVALASRTEITCVQSFREARFHDFDDEAPPHRRQSTSDTTPTKRPVKTSTLPPIEYAHKPFFRTSKTPIDGSLTHFRRHLRQPQSWGIATTRTPSHHPQSHADTLAVFHVTPVTSAAPLVLSAHTTARRGMHKPIVSLHTVS